LVSQFMTFEPSWKERMVRPVPSHDTALALVTAAAATTSSRSILQNSFSPKSPVGCRATPGWERHHS
jgi:hypothetical protein